MAENSFQNTVEALFKGMDSFITTKTVVGDAITVGDTIIFTAGRCIFWCGSRSICRRHKNNGAGGMAERFLRQLFWSSIKTEPNWSM